MKLKPLAWPSKRTLQDLAAGRGADDRVSGRSEHGGLTTVMACLRRRGLIDRDDNVTPKGMELVESWKGHYKC